MVLVRDHEPDPIALMHAYYGGRILPTSLGAFADSDDTASGGMSAGIRALLENS
jgi:hypothetical protein